MSGMPPLRGREGEFALIRELLAAAGRGEGSLLVVQGPGRVRQDEAIAVGARTGGCAGAADGGGRRGRRRAVGADDGADVRLVRGPPAAAGPGQASRAAFGAGAAVLAAAGAGRPAGSGRAGGSAADLPGRLAVGRSGHSGGAA